MDHVSRRAGLLGLSFALLSLVACGGGGGGGGGSASKIAIKGNFSGGTHLTRVLRWLFGSAHALDPNAVSKVVVFHADGRHYAADVKDGSFSISVEQGTPVGLVFVGAADNYLGYLSLKDGIDSLPLTKLDADVTAIDLKTLASNGQIVEAGHNPIGAELPLSDSEKTAVARSDDFFAAVVKNADLDGDGKIDVLTPRHFYPQILYFIGGGTLVASAPAAPHTPANIKGHRLALHAVDAATRPESVTFSGPAGYPGSTSEQKNDYPDATTYFSAYVQSVPVPSGGEYQVQYGSTTLRFTLPDQSAAPSSVLLPLPTLTVDGSGVVKKVSWEYRLGDGTGPVDPQVIIGRAEMQFEGTGTPCASYPQNAGRPEGSSRFVYVSGPLAPSATEHVLTCPNVKWSELTVLHTTYNDAYGNHYVVTWNGPASQ